MSESSAQGRQLFIVGSLQLIGMLEVIGGVILLLIPTKVIDPTLGGILGNAPPKTEHDWALGAVYLGAALTTAVILFGFAHLIQDTHDIKRRILLEDEDNPYEDEEP
jgi:hypothetical protein